jgi:glutamyl-tRNA synthetase
MVAPLRTRFAPSPTGDLHLGGAYVALASWLLARATGGALVLRVEDLDPPRVVPGASDAILDDLAWLGLDADEGPREGGPAAPYVQSERGHAYAAALALLEARGLVYPCDCSRAEIARVASAPHEGEELRYPGTCRDKDPHRAFKRPPALRARVPDEELGFVDEARGPYVQRLARDVGDFVLRRGDGVWAYQLAVIADDLAMRIDLVVRGEDLLPSTPRQLWLARALGATDVPRYAHLPLVVGADGSRLSKRTAGSSVRELRGRGIAPEEIVGVLASALRLGDGSPVAAAALVARVHGTEWLRGLRALRVPEPWAR